jgi:hypothetical protein
MSIKRFIALLVVVGLIWIATVWGVFDWFTPEPHQPPPTISEVLK